MGDFSCDKLVCSECTSDVPQIGDAVALSVGAPTVAPAMTGSARMGSYTSTVMHRLASVVICRMPLDVRNCLPCSAILTHRGGRVGLCAYRRCLPNLVGSEAVTLMGQESGILRRGLRAKVMYNCEFVEAWCCLTDSSDGRDKGDPARYSLWRSQVKYSRRSCEDLTSYLPLCRPT